MKINHNISISFVLSLLCCLSVGCTLEDIVERGDVCPPGDMRIVKDQFFVSFEKLDCYPEYEILIDIPEDAISHCETCEEEKTMLGTILKCYGLSEQCKSRLTEIHVKDYNNCLAYRNYGIFNDDGSKSEERKNQIAFVHNFKGEAQDMAENGVDELTRYCPLKYRNCSYNDPSTGDSNTPAWFGCEEPCLDPYLHCNETDGKIICIDPFTDNKHCGAKGSCSDPSRSSANWIGDDCVGGTCVDGVCACPAGYAYCPNGEYEVCYNIKHDRYHCGEDCIPCDDDKFCIDGVCSTNECAKTNYCKQPNDECRNSQEMCGPSCMDCSGIMNIKKGEDYVGAECNKELGICEIKECQEGYHIALDENHQHQICEPNSDTKCAPPTILNGESVDDPNRIEDCTKIQFATSVNCNKDGKCEVLACKDDRLVGDGYCEDTTCDSQCDDNERCVGGVCECIPGFTNCGEDIGCVDIVNDKNNCGGCGEGYDCHPEIKDSSNVTESECVHARCMVQKCKQGFHVYGNECEENTMEHCGSHDNDCNKIEHTIPDTVSCDINEGICKFECEKTHHVYSEEQTCEANDITNCLKHDAMCLVDNAESMMCDNDHGCFIEKCNYGYHVYIYECEVDSELNCGDHEYACGEHFICKDAKCQCDTGYSPCKGSNSEDICVDLTSNNTHCGACDHNCPTDANCSSSTCVCNDTSKHYCPASNSCVDFQTDKKNCGSCGNECKANEDCCGGTCTDITTTSNCGSCGKVCPIDRVCKSGSCQCPDGQGDCGSGTCITLNSNSNCGSCGNVCYGDSNCNGTECVCSGGLHYCNKSCVSYNTQANCGSCGNNCGSLPCISGSCGCPSDQHVYDGGCESDSTSNCGGHGIKCNVSNAYNSCSGGSCHYSCNYGYHDAGGWCEKDGCPYGTFECGEECCNSNQNCDYGRCVDKPSCPAGTTGTNCDSCLPGYTDCGTYNGQRMCMDMTPPSGYVTIYYCEDYCNTYDHWGGQGTKYYVTRCESGQKCYLKNYNDGQKVICSW